MNLKLPVARLLALIPDPVQRLQDLGLVTSGVPPFDSGMGMLAFGFLCSHRVSGRIILRDIDAGADALFGLCHRCALGSNGGQMPCTLPAKPLVIASARRGLV